MKLTVNQRPSGATTCHLALTSGEVTVMSPRQQEDLAIGLALLQAALMDDQSFFADGAQGRALEVMAGHELAEAVEEVMR